MLNQSVCIGRVVEVMPDRDAMVVVVRTASGQKHGGGEWEELVACRFWGDKYTKLVYGVAPGMLVRVDGSVKSRKGQQGGYFTALECRYLVKIAEPTRAQHSREQAPADDDGSDPF